MDLASEREPLREIDLLEEVLPDTVVMALARDDLTAASGELREILAP